MLNRFPIAAAVGSVLGFLSGLGVGGGSLLMLWLTLVLGLEQTAARGINLLFFLPSAVIACCFRWRQGSIRMSEVLPGALCGCISAVLFSKVGANIDLHLLKKLFGWLLLFTGVRELLYTPKDSQ